MARLVQVSISPQTETESHTVHAKYLIKIFPDNVGVKIAIIAPVLSFLLWLLCPKYICLILTINIHYKHLLEDCNILTYGGIFLPVYWS